MSTKDDPPKRLKHLLGGTLSQGKENRQARLNQEESLGRWEGELMFSTAWCWSLAYVSQPALWGQGQQMENESIPSACCFGT